MPTYQDTDGTRYFFDEEPAPGTIRPDLVLVPDDAPVDVAVQAVPDVVEARQLLVSLDAAGLLDDIEAFVATQPRAVQINWQRMIYVRRNHELLNAAVAQLGMSDAQVDALFVAAAGVL